ncbi:hypothetical protein D3C74_354590 [compost metagenome]
MGGDRFEQFRTYRQIKQSVWGNPCGSFAFLDPLQQALIIFLTVDVQHMIAEEAEELVHGLRVAGIPSRKAVQRPLDVCLKGLVGPFSAAQANHGKNIRQLSIQKQVKQGRVNFAFCQIPGCPKQYKRIGIHPGSLLSA